MQKKHKVRRLEAHSKRTEYLLACLGTEDDVPAGVIVACRALYRIEGVAVLELTASVVRDPK